jgi:hypothetical protein
MAILSAFFFIGAVLGAITVALGGRTFLSLWPLVGLQFVALATLFAISTWINADIISLMVPWVVTPILGSLAGGLLNVANGPDAAVWFRGTSDAGASTASTKAD